MCCADRTVCFDISFLYQLCILMLFCSLLHQVGDKDKFSHRDVIVRRTQQCSLPNVLKKGFGRIVSLVYCHALEGPNNPNS